MHVTNTFLNKVNIMEIVDLTREKETSNRTRPERKPKPTKEQAHVRLLEDDLKAPSFVKKKDIKQH